MAKGYTEAYCQNMVEDGGSEDLGGVFVMWSSKKCLMELCKFEIPTGN